MRRRFYTPPVALGNPPRAWIAAARGASMGRCSPPWRLEIHDTLDSTSDLCAERAAAGEADGLAVLALRQTRARGSRGRSWSSPPGSLALSVLLRDAGKLSEIGWLPLLAGVALIEALSRFVPEPRRLSLKWPNDVNLDGRKLAGILIEAAAAGPVAETVVIGFGANLAAAPALPDRAAAGLDEAADQPPAPEAFAPVLLDRVWSWRRRTRTELRAAWLDRAHPLGEVMTVTAAGRMVEGAFAGLDESGRLLLEARDGLRTVGAGEVLLGRPA